MLEHALELVVVLDPDDDLEPELLAALRVSREHVVLVHGQDDRVGRVGRGIVRRRAVREQRQRGVASGALAPAPRATTPSAPPSSARSAAAPSRTSTSTEIPSPSAIAWLNRRCGHGRGW